MFDSIPDALKVLQSRLKEHRDSGNMELQNGDHGYASSPSNIALIKYWGKEDKLLQIPLNNSLSLTLGGFRTHTQVRVLGRFLPHGHETSARPFSHKFALKNEDGIEIENIISDKMIKFLDAILFPFAPEISLSVQSQNFFPTGCGIASSASGYAALVGAIADLLQIKRIFNREEQHYWITQWARLGSGSATRSGMLGDDDLFVCWERILENGEVKLTTTEKIKHHPLWDRNLCHWVVVLDKTPKEVSSSQGHLLSKNTPLQIVRLAQIQQSYQTLKKAIEEFNFSVVAQLSEQDAFAMHAVMQSSQPAARYLTTPVAQFISHFVSFRNRNNLNCFWTLDAGPNVHLVALKNAESSVEHFLDDYMGLENSAPINIYKNKFQQNCLLLGRS